MSPPFETSIQVRFRDIDTMGHVNNAVYATYIEQARSDYFREVLDAKLESVDTVLATVTIDYKRPVKLGQDVTVSLSVPSLGSSSIPMEYEIRADGDVAATAETVQVVIDPETERSRPIPDEWRAAMTEFEGL